MTGIAGPAAVGVTFGLIPDLRVTVTNAFASGPYGVVEVVREGTHTGPVPLPDGPEAPPTGRAVRLPECAVFEVRGGQVVRMTVYADQLDISRQFGLLPEYATGWGAVEPGAPGGPGPQRSRHRAPRRMLPLISTTSGPPGPESPPVLPRSRLTLTMRLLAVPLLLVGCQPETGGAPPSREISLPRLTAEAGRERMEALLPGALSLDGRCLYVTAAEGGTRYLVIWPPSASIVKLPPEPGLHVHDAETGASVPIRMDGGSDVVLSGGEVGDRRPAPDALAHPVPDECPGPYWIAGAVLDAVPPPAQPPPPDPQ